MIYDIRHRTTYKYESAVTFARCVLRLTPPSTSGQTVLRSGVTVFPHARAHARPIRGVRRAHLTVLIDAAHEQLVIEARSRVDVHPSRDTLPFRLGVGGCAGTDARRRFHRRRCARPPSCTRPAARRS